MRYTVLTLQTDLEALLATLESAGSALGVERKQAVGRVGSVLRQNMLANSQDRRRVERIGSRDNIVMRFGQAAEIKDAFDVCDVAFCGAQHAGGRGLRWQFEAAVALLASDPEASIDPLDLLRETLRDPGKRRYLTELGAFVRFRYVSAAYWADCAAFEASIHGQDPNAAWRARAPTPRQNFLIARIFPLLAADAPDFCAPALTTRGEAQEFIAAAGGNPRFAQPPQLPVF